MSTLSSVLHTPSFPIVAPFSLIPLCPPHRLLTLHLLFYRFTSSSLRHSHCLRHSVLPSPIVSAEVQCGCCLPKPASFLSRPHPFTPLQPICPESLFTTSSFLSLSPLIYLSRWAPTRSDALPLCLCCVCVLFVSPYLPQWNSLVCLRPQWLHPNRSLCWLSQGPGHQGLHFRKGERALCGSVASWCACYYHGPTILAFIFPPHFIPSFKKNAPPVLQYFNTAACFISAYITLW